ncbi:acetylxylan esterase [Luethyella okanaganae]|uniref:acetylxylan esterase n=1 Tax=Luethyella okanaganae TaxID=69372 RepID=UPI0036DACFE8
MPLFDWPLERLVRYRPPRREPSDFDRFWQTSLKDAAGHNLDVTLRSWHGHLTLVDVFDVEFSGFSGDRIRAWLLLPKHRTAPLPGVIQFVGYGGGRGIPYEWLSYSNAGYAHLVMDNRGQGGGGSITAVTPDTAHSPIGPSAPGFLTRGIDDPDNHYYRRLIVDASRAVDALASLPEIDAARIAVVGASQGGGLSLAVGALRPHLAAVLTDVPFLCDFPRAVTITDAGPYAEVADFLRGDRSAVERTLDTLSYFDATNFAARATAPARFTVGLMDRVCPPSTVYAAHNHYTAAKQLVVYPFNGHEGGGQYDLPGKLDALREAFGG